MKIEIEQEELQELLELTGTAMLEAAAWARKYAELATVSMMMQVSTGRLLKALGKDALNPYRVEIDHLYNTATLCDSMVAHHRDGES